MRYFKETALWKIILLNIIVGLCMSGPLLIGMVLYSGLFTHPTTSEKLLGLFIFIVILFVILLSNFLLWKFGKKRPIEYTNEENKIVIPLKLILILIILCSAVGSFFIFPDIWLKLNGWWF